MLFDRMQTAIENYVRENWVATAGIAYDNVPLKTDLYEEWSRCNIMFGVPEMRSLGLMAKGEYRQNGLVMLSIFVKPATGTARMNELLNAAYGLFLNVILPPVLNDDAVAATDSLAITSFFRQDDIVTIGGQTYVMDRTLVNVPNHVFVPTNVVSAGALNLISAINGTGAPGVDYGVGTVVNPSVTAVADLAHNQMLVNAKIPGVAGNSITVYTNSPAASWTAGQLTGGKDRSGLTPAVIFQVPSTIRDLNAKDGWVMAQASAPFYYDLER